MSERPLHVCLINLWAYPLFNPEVKSTFGGAEVDLYLIATELATDERFKVSFVTGDFGQPAIEERQGVRIIKSVNVRGNLFLGGWRIWRALKLADADVYFDECAGLRTFLDWQFCRFTKRPYVYRTAAAEECDGSYIARHPLGGRLFLKVIRGASKVITQNESDRQKLLETTGITSEVIRNTSRPIRQAEIKRDTILWVGRSAAVKGPRRFLQLARENPDMHFTMICQPALNDASFNLLAEEAAAITNLKFIAGVPFEKIDDYFMRALALVNTSDSEGFPNVFVQAAKCGTPILSLNVNPDDFLNRYKCGLYADSDWQRFTNMLHKLLEPDTYAQYIASASRYFHENHDLGMIIELYKSVFQQATRQK